MKFEESDPDKAMEAANRIRTFGFSEAAEDVFGRELGALAVFIGLFRWPDAKIRRMGSAAIGNVFGGMGSWNDQGFDNPKDHAEYEVVSDRLFRALQKFTELAWNA